MSVTADVVMKRSNGMSRTRSAEAAAAAVGEDARSRRAALDPREQRDHEQRGEVEEVPLLDPEGEDGRERRDRGDEASDEREGGREESLELAVERARPRDQHDRRCHRDDQHVEPELSRMPDDVPERLAQVVARIPDRRVRAEEIARRPSRGELHDEREHAERGERSVQEPVLA